MYYWGHGKLGRCVIQLSKFLNHTLATHNQVDSFFEHINYNDGKGAFTLTLFEMTITDCPGFHVPHCIHTLTMTKIWTLSYLSVALSRSGKIRVFRIQPSIRVFCNFMAV
jgi:hypothetical protein